ncbi:GDP-L-fucose synthase family protein [Meridianimaribacter flavus]|uniref:GDP-L-fucose synthase n=1 Tax=Meridianimaribacter flavus TaxID=571115 RepID=A0ABY2G720_9FLAO|nr:GDP-L-fucose synthase [Meridianimaribacter flavus]TDY13580.1 GDP-L-fucose synthase [Meridianimaribacter flavus]
MKKDSKIYVAGHRGLVGSAIVENLKSKGYTNLVTRTHSELDLTNQVAVEDFFKSEKPEYVFLAAAKVGGIIANNVYRADFIYANMMIQNNVIHQSYLNGVSKLLFLGSTCIYPKNAPQPMKEEYLLTDTLEYTNEPYAIAKIAGIKTCESYNLQYGTNFISVMPTNLYGPNDNFDLEKSHVLPALIRKIYLAKMLNENNLDAVISDTGFETIEEAKVYLSKFGVSENSVEIWGTGAPKREFLWSKDMADACVFIMENREFSDTYSENDSEIRNTHINIGTGKEISIKELAETIKSIIDFKGDLVFNTDKPDGTMRKLTDVSKLNGLGWKHSVELEDGIKKVYDWYVNK